MNLTTYLSQISIHAENTDCKLEAKPTSKQVVQMLTMNSAIFGFELSAISALQLWLLKELEIFLIK